MRVKPKGYVPPTIEFPLFDLIIICICLMIYDNTRVLDGICVERRVSTCIVKSIVVELSGVSPYWDRLDTAVVCIRRK